MWGDVLLSLLFTAISIAMYLEALTLPAGLFGTLGPGYFPKFVLGGLIVASGSLTLRLVSRAIAAHRKAAAEGQAAVSGGAKQDDVSGDKIKDAQAAPLTFYQKYRLVGLVFAAFFFYLYGMKWVGFMPATLVFMIGTMWLLAPAGRNRGTAWVVLVTSVLFTYGLYAMFTHGFNVMLPGGVLF